MAHGDYWTQDWDEELFRLYSAGCCDLEIAMAMGRSKDAISTRRSYLGLTGPHNVSTPRFAPAIFPRFEDISKAEARTITATQPPSGRFSRQPITSGMTSCAIMVMEA